MGSIPSPIDPSTVPTLSGVFAPVTDERDAADLVVRGEIPADLRGAYVRNGPNPLFPPLGSYTFPLEGDAMLHGIWVDDDGAVRYRNRFVWTPQMRLEQQAGHALWAGLMTPYLPGPDIVPAPYANDFKPAPSINVVHHGGRWLAMSEVDPPWEVTSGLEVVGTTPFTWGGAIAGACAHPRLDPATGEMVLFRYDFTEPYLVWATVAADGSVAHGPDPVEIDGSYMIHDFVITSRYVVLFVAPVRFDLQALLDGKGPPLAWHDEPVRIAVIPRTGTSADVTWLETDPFWAYHYANGFDDGDDVVVDFARFSHFSLGDGGPPPTGAVTRARLDLGAGTVRLDSFDDRITEFPRIDDRLQGRPHRYFTVSGKSAGVPMGQFNALIRVDTHTGSLTEWNSGRKVFDEVVFAPAEGGEPEQGYYVAFRTDVDTLESEWFVLDASDIAAGPVATVELGLRVPNGLHGSWFPASALA